MLAQCTEHYRADAFGQDIFGPDLDNGRAAA